MKDTVTVICSCKNRDDILNISLKSWLNFKEISEIIIVDWSSDRSLSYLVSLDDRITVVSVPNQTYFNQPEPLNLAVNLATSKYILKLDCDYILNPYYNFFDTYKVDERSFLCGQNDYKELEINSSPYFKHLRGLLFVSKENYLKVGGYNVVHTKHYAYEDDEIVHRLELLGLKKQKVCYNHTIVHMPHSDKKRIENFEAYHTDKELEKNIREMLSPYYSGEELEWQIEYTLAQQHIEINRQKSLKEITDYYFQTKLSWNLIKTGKRTYQAQKKLMNDSKLKGFPKTYYISLEESLERQSNIKNQFSRYNIKPYAVISKRFAESNDKVSGKYLHTLNDGTKGCCISHLKCIQHWYENNDDEYGFFCEDDLSLETVQYWDFTWEEFVNDLPPDWDVVQLLTIRKDFGDFKLRERYWDDWSVTAYIVKRDYAKRLIDNYIKEDTYHLEIPNSDTMPLIENILFTSLGKCYTIPLFVEDTKFNSTYTPEHDSDVKNGQKTNHYHANEVVLNYWKNRFTKITTMSDTTHEKDLQTLTTEYSLDTENPNHNFNLGVWYETNGHTAPALSYFLRCAERSEDLDLAYEALIRGSYCYEKQGTRDGTAKSLLQQALCLLPNRPEAYFLLSRFSERRQWWQDCYIYADWGLQFADFNLKPLRTNVEYPGYYGLLFEKSLGAWWWGKSQESKNILLDLKENYPLTEEYKKSVIDNLKKIGVEVKEELNKSSVSLTNIFDAQKYNTDKNDLGYLNHFYDEFFGKVKNVPINLMEIGVNKGGSIKLWKDYLHADSKICAADINYFDHIEGTTSIIGDMYSYDQVSKFSDEHFDVIIDDGPHTFESFVLVMQRYFSKLKRGGTLIIEDIIVSSWVTPLVELSKSLGYSNCQVVDMTGKQKTQKLLDRWKNGLFILKIVK